MDESTVPRWQRVWAQLPREVRGQLINLVLLGLLVGSFLLVYLTAMLFLGGARVVEWLQEQPSPYAVMDYRYFTHCLDQVEALHQAAVELQRRENTPGVASDSAYASWHSRSLRFERDCSGRHWPGQGVPESPVDWLPHLGLTAQDWPASVPTRPDE